MAITQVYTAVPNDVITAARWNNEFGNIYNNGTQVAFPATTAVSFNGFTVTFDVSGVTTLATSSSQGFSLTPGVKSGTPNTTGKAVNVVANTFTDSNTGISGTAALFASVAIQQPTLAASNTGVKCTEASTLYIAGGPANGTNETITNSYSLFANGDVKVTGALAGTLALGNWMQGLTYANNVGDAVNDIDIAVGSATDNGSTASARKLMLLTSALTKESDVPWAVGTNTGMLDTGVVGNSDYYLWLIMRPDTGVVDVLSSLSSTAPTMPANYTLKRLFGWFKRVGGTVVAFTTSEGVGGGLDFQWSVPTLDIDLSNTLTTTRRTDAIKVPLNLSVRASIRAVIDDAAIFSVLICDPNETDAAVSTTAAPLFNVRSHVAGIPGGAQLVVKTSAAGLIAARATANTMDSYRVLTAGFLWARRD